MPENIYVGISEKEGKTLLDIDSLNVIATDMYKAGGGKRFWLGDNYREAWSAVVRVPVIRLDEVEGGLRPVDVGGGMQTMSLEFEDSRKIRYTFRTVNKNPAEAVPPLVRTLGLQGIFKDGISGAHPYGALIVIGMADAIGVYHTKPRLVFLPRQSILDTLNPAFGNRLFLMEYESEGDVGSWLEIPGVKEIIDDKDLKERLKNSSDNRIDAEALLRVRLFDLLIGDFDRHQGQWGWAVVDSGKGELYIPVAADRDNAFFCINGVLPWVFSRPIFIEKLRPFKKNIEYLPGLVENGDKIDGEFLWDLDQNVFIEEAAFLQKTLTDEVITASVKKWPSNIYKLDGPEIIAKLISRRNKLDKHALKYYQILQKRKKKSKS